MFKLNPTGTPRSPIAASPASAAIRAPAVHPESGDDEQRRQPAHLGRGRRISIASAALHASVDGGNTWSAANNGLRAVDIEALTIDPTTTGSVAATTIYAGGRAASNGNTGYVNFGLYRSDDGGANWGTLDGNLPVANSYLGPLRALALDPNSCALPPCTTANGPLQRVYAVGHGRAPDDQLIADQTHRVLRSNDRGATWTDLSVNPGFPRSNFRSTRILQRVDAHRRRGRSRQRAARIYVGTEAEFYDLDSGDAIPLDTARKPGLFKSTDAGATWSRVTGCREDQRRRPSERLGDVWSTCWSIRQPPSALARHARNSMPRSVDRPAQQRRRRHLGRIRERHQRQPLELRDPPRLRPRNPTYTQQPRPASRQPEVVTRGL
ncbi:MAG: exo-alpha-sialidase [Xanthomonadales bacterium]|nr:exo-alpha-sialidase [Xanthomonadales bacterium]